MYIIHIDKGLGVKIRKEYPYRQQLMEEIKWCLACGYAFRVEAFK